MLEIFILPYMSPGQPWQSYTFLTREAAEQDIAASKAYYDFKNITLGELTPISINKTTTYGLL